MKKVFFIGLFLFSLFPLVGEEVVEEEVKIDLKLEKAEEDLLYMKEKVDFYKRVVRSIEREEEELKTLKKIKIRK